MIVLAFDPGTHETGWCRVDVRGTRPNPITITLVDLGNVESSVEGVWPLLAGADVVAVEVLRGIAYPVKGAGIVGSLVSSSAVAGGIVWLARGGRFHVVETTAREWRGVVMGRPQASDAEIGRVIPGLVRGWPRRSNSHARDAAGLAVGTAWKMGGARVKQEAGAA